MPIINSPFKTPFYLRNPHVQTLLPSRTRNPKIPKREQSFLETHDGDLIELEAVLPNNLVNKTNPENKNSLENDINNKHAILLIHGLTGSADSQYIVGLQNLLKGMGVFSVAMNFRGAKKPNNLALGYHSGSSNDIAEIVSHLQKSYSNYQWHAIGFSLGGNVLLKYLGENPNTTLNSAMAVSVPFSLDICATRMDQGFSKVYRNHLLSELNIYLAQKHTHLKNTNPQQAKLLAETPISKKFHSFWDFDHEIIAPIHGFDSAKDYYHRCSSRQFLKDITIPTHILNAIDDPFLSPELIPSEEELSNVVTLELSKLGGHVGFFSGRSHYYVESLVERLFTQNSSLSA